MSAVATPRERGRIELMSRVRLRREELEEAVFARMLEGDYVSSGDGDAEYVAGLRATLKAAVEYALDTLEPDDVEAGPAPPQAIAQARRAARLGVNLDTVLRRYVLGSTMLGDLLVEEAGNSDLGEHPMVLREVLREQAAVLEQLLASITAAYNAELKRGSDSSARRLVEHVQALLTGAPGDLRDHGYDLDGWHIGAIATGASAAGELRRAAEALQASLLYVPCGDHMAWAWLGGRGAITVADVELALLGGRLGTPASVAPTRAPGRSGGRELAVALGEPAWALEGWRLTHRQAQAAMRVALRAPQPLTRYADVALLAAVLRDDLLADSMIEVYLSPLGDRRGAGAPLRETLRAYYKADRNASSAASALGVTRHTVENRLRAIEEKLGHTLRTRQAELEVALRLEELTHGIG
ncbi:MAG TPA: helix-turn-helix domain-containing protein [Solirubrobacteraceae bacterium]|nr:helix-turn-helix domain-containing protein [Solirubrobacteraceae bacterium]